MSSLEFLKQWKPGGPWGLVAIQLDKKDMAAVNTRDEEAIQKFVDEHNDKRNLYFHVNNIFTKVRGKASKDEVVSACCLHVDIDPIDGKDWARERQRILALLTVERPESIPKPSLIIDSGGGYQAFWLLTTAVEIGGDEKAAEEFELYNLRLAQILGGDNCQNVDRIMRLPETVNIPDEKKKKKGRSKRKSVVVLFDPTLRYSIDQFEKAKPAFNENSHEGGDYGIDVDISGEKRPTEDLSDLDRWGIEDDLKIIIAQGSDPSKPLKGDNSRSAWLWACVCRLLEKGVPDRVIYDIITDDKWMISVSVLDKGNVERYAKRQIRKAKENGVSPDLMHMNEKYAIILDLYGKCRVIKERFDEVMKRTVLTVFDFSDVHKAEDNRHVTWIDDKGKEHRQPRGKWWLYHPYRRQFNLMRFAPGVDEAGIYNMWRGFSYEPAQGDCSLYMAHLRDNICSGNEEWYDYLIKWMARCVQLPGEHGEVAVVLQGLKGAGKSVMATMLGALFGRHFFHASDPGQVVGNFNAHLEDVVLLFADEAFFAGDRRQDQALKRIITEKSLAIEPKGYDKRQCRNYIHLIIASNEDHVIRATGDERRYFILKVNSSRRQDKAYFQRLVAQMEAGGYSALLDYLLKVDLSGFDVRSPPKTEALKEQVLRSMSHDEEWWFNKLNSGIFVDKEGWPTEVFANALRDDYYASMDRQKVTHRMSETQMGTFLKKVAPAIQKRKGTIDKVRHNKYIIPPLEDLRKSWEKEFGPVDWEEASYPDLSRDDNPF